jgi:hypothetical protein
MTRVVARLRSFDFDDLCAKVGEDHGAVRSCQDARQVQDADTFERR